VTHVQPAAPENNRALALENLDIGVCASIDAKLSPLPVRLYVPEVRPSPPGCADIVAAGSLATAELCCPLAEERTDAFDKVFGHRRLAVRFRLESPLCLERVAK
jgi:hypothetical protein